MIDTEKFDPGFPHPGTNDTIEFDWVARDRLLAGFLRISVRPADQCSWCSVVVHPVGSQPVVVLDWSLPTASGGFAFRAPGIWADLVCETPIEQWTVGLEAFGVAVEPGEVLTPDSFGERTPVGLDLDVEAISAPDELVSGFEHRVSVRGEVLVGPDAYEIDGRGTRRRWWGPYEPLLERQPPDLEIQTQIAIQWPDRPTPHRRGWVLGSRPGWVELSS